MPTPKRSKKSGSEKLADFRDKKVTPGESPEDYRNKVEAEIKSTNDVSPLAQKGAQRELSEAERQAIRDQHDTSPLRPDKIKDKLYDGSVFSFPAQEERSAADLRREIVQSQTQQSTSYIPFMKSSEQQLREVEAKDQEAAMNLRGFESTAAGYEAHVEKNLSPLTESKNPVVRFAGGAAEAVLYTPVAVPRLITGLSRDPAGTVKATVEGTAEQVVRDPARGTGQLLGMAVTGKAFGEGARPIIETVKAKTPAVSLKSTPQEFIIKTKIPDAAKPLTEQPKPITQAEFTGRALGQDVFKISEIQSQVGSAAKQQPTYDVLVGKNKGGYTDVYLKVDKPTAQSLSRQFTGNVENVKTPQSSAVVFEPTGMLENTILGKTKASRIGTQERTLIGNQKGPSIGLDNPFRIEKRVNAKPATLEFTEPAKAIPEFTKTVNAKGKVVNDFNINDYYKTPDFADPLRLKSGTQTVKVPIDEPIRSFAADTRGQLFPKQRYTTKTVKNEPFIGEMPEMQTKYVKFAEPTKAPLENILKSDLETIIRREAPEGKRGTGARRTPGTGRATNIRRQATPSRSAFPAIYPLSSQEPIPDTSVGIYKQPPANIISGPYTEPFVSTSNQPSPNRGSTGNIVPEMGIKAAFATPNIPVIKQLPFRKQKRNKEFSDPFTDFGRFNKKWKNPTLTGLDILGSPRRKK